ncbi:MAG: glycosyltransferase [Clostridia bacterium]|nr:glycosyltransferase [Clostridia bacterium]
MGKSVLIITYYYKHKNAMASVRPIKLAKYFKKVGPDVTVLTSNQKDTWTKEYIKPVADPRITEIYATENRRWAFIKKYLSHRGRVGQKRIANSGSAVQTDSKAASGLAAVKARIKKTVSWLFYFNLAKQEDICMYKGLKAEIKRQKLKDFDAVIATYPTYGAFLTGIWMKKTGRCKQFIADFRDPLYNPGFRNKKTEANYDLRCLKKTLRAADKVVCVSNGIADGIKAEFPGYKKPIRVITNGFDPDDAQIAKANKHNDGKTHFVYTGTLYHGKRCVNMLCEAIKLLEADKGVKPMNLSLSMPDRTATK